MSSLFIFLPLPSRSIAAQCNHRTTLVARLAGTLYRSDTINLVKASDPGISSLIPAKVNFSPYDWDLRYQTQVKSFLDGY